MKRQIFTSIALVISSLAFSQIDTIYSNNQMIPCNVKEVTPDAIKFSYPEEDLTNTLYINAIQKIVFKSGRVQTFSQTTSFKKVESVADFENVTITQVEGELKGLFKVGDVSSKAKGTTNLANQERVKERAYRKLKMEAAMQGANIVYLTDQRTEGNKMGSYYQSGSSAETNLSGVAYTSLLPNFNDFEKLIGEKRDFIASQQIKLWSSASDLSITEIHANFHISKVINETGFIELEGQLEGNNKTSKFKVVTFSNDRFNVYFEDKSTVYNVTIEL